jgi:sedoheptulokinase
MQAIGIDLGTTSVCGVSVDLKSGLVLKSKTINSNAFIEGREFEKIQSPEKIIGIATEILEQLVTEETAVIGVTGQMHGIVYYDKDGNAVSPLYTWQDARGNEPFKDTTYAEFLNSKSGYGAVTDFYNRQNGLVPNTALSYCTIHDYLVMKLCSLKKAKIHSSDAASFGLYNLKSNTFEFENNLQVVSDYCIAGDYKGIPVSVAIGDNQASVFSCLKDEDSLLLNVGTGSQVSIISDDIIESENLETRPYFEGKYLVVGAALCGGRAYSLLKDFYAKILDEGNEGKVYAKMDKMLESIEKSTISVDTRFAGTRSDVLVKGSVSGITVDNFTPSALTRGVLFGMIKELYDMYKHGGKSAEKLVCSGNGMRKNAPLRRITSEMFGCEIKIPLYAEEASFGAALAASVCCGINNNIDEACKVIKYKEG